MTAWKLLLVDRIDCIILCVSGYIYLIQEVERLRYGCRIYDSAQLVECVLLSFSLTEVHVLSKISQLFGNLCAIPYKTSIAISKTKEVLNIFL